MELRVRSVRPLFVFLLLAAGGPAGAQEAEGEISETGADVYVSSASEQPAAEPARSPGVRNPARSQGDGGGTAGYPRGQTQQNPSGASSGYYGSAPAGRSSQPVPSFSSSRSGGSSIMNDPRVPYMSKQVLQQAGAVAAKINNSGGFRLDGENDAWGFIRRVWDPQLKAMKKPALPARGAAAGDWAPIASWARLLPGDIVATPPGDTSGKAWHGGLCYQGGKGYDNFPGKGVQLRQLAGLGLRYYYVPTHKLLEDDNGGGGGESTRTIIEHPEDDRAPLPCFLRSKDIIRVYILGGRTVVRYKANDYTNTGSMVEAVFESLCLKDRGLVKSWVRQH